MGRPTKRTPERIELVIAAMENGATLTDAACVAGLSTDTQAAWRRGGHDRVDPIERVTACGAGAAASVARPAKPFP